MKRLVALFAALTAFSFAQAERILLIPLDSRPAAGQFAQMIGRMAAIDVRMPPYETLGQFTSPGNPDKILTWLEQQDLSDVVAVVASTDMIAYGGLIPSREEGVSVSLALSRLRRLSEIVRKSSSTRLFAFSSTMRLVPTATKQKARWRMQLAKYVELRDKASRFPSLVNQSQLANLKSHVPVEQMRWYERTRVRNHEVQVQLVRMMGARRFDYLVIGQDDAREFGPHVPENKQLRAIVEQIGVAGLVYFCEGIDQHANVLLSRALLKANDWTPKVRIIYSDPAAATQFAAYESKPIGKSLEDQLLASGARVAEPGGNYDYSLFLNSPNPRASELEKFLKMLREEVDQGFPISVADINLSLKDGTSDPRVFAVLNDNARIFRLLSFAGWNTAGNTMGTAIPAANVYLLARRLRVDPLAREVAQREFLLHRFVNDISYHKITRPEAYRLLDSLPGATREETYGKQLAELNQFVQRDMLKHLTDTFRTQFLGQRFFAGTDQFVFVDLSDIKIFLPWPRVYEVRLEFRLQAKLLTP
ncbi:MAG: DUF4127 family protein [Fimbriimonas sp.]